MAGSTAGPTDIKAFNRAVIDEFRANNGRVSHEMLARARLLLLTTIGARSGRPHTTPLGYFSDGPGRIVLWASAMGAPKHPDWYRNLVAHPEVTIELGSESGSVRRYTGRTSTAEGGERDRLFEMIRSERPHVAAHQDRTERTIPIVLIEYGTLD